MADQSPRARGSSKQDAAMKTLVSAKARKELAMAEAAEMENSYAKKQIVIRSEAEKIAFETSRNLRDRINSLSIKLAPKLANIDNPEEITRILKDSYCDLLRTYIEEIQERI